MRDAAGEFNDVEAALNVAAGVSNHLAMFGRKRPRQFFDILLNQFLEAEHDARAALRIHSGPTGLRRLRRFHRTIQISLGAKTPLSLNHAFARIENVADTASAAERKRVVYGKSVFVSVDLGGRRIIKHQTRLSYLRREPTQHT